MEKPAVPDRTDPAGGPMSETTPTTEKWREAGWESPDAVLDALTAERLRMHEVYAVLDRLNALRPEQFKSGQGHLSPAFREIDFREAFKAVVNLAAEIEEVSGYSSRVIPPTQPAPVSSQAREETEEACPTPGCPGDVRYAAPGRRHASDCHYPAPEVSL